MDPRLFEQHEIRKTRSLDGVWDLYFPAGAGTRIGALDLDGAKKTTLLVPGVWENLDARKSYRGQAVLRRGFTARRSGPARLVFKGVSHTGHIFLDGKEIGWHHNAFTPFAIDLPRLAAGEHDLRVHVNNEHDLLHRNRENPPVSALHVPNDYYDYGGINRPVQLQEVAASGVYVKRVHFNAFPAAAGWKVRLTAFLTHLGKAAVKGDLALRVAGNETVLAGLELAPGENRFQAELECRDVKTWSPGTPELYFLDAEWRENGIAVDDWRERVGFRSFEIRGQDLYLNGEKTFLAGCCRHEDHQDFGNAIPLEVHRRDLEIMRELNCNAVRTTHYPNDERFLDLCDEMGFLVWTENHARGLFDNSFSVGVTHPLFREQCRQVNEEMVTEHYNHPAIVMWGILNECDSYSDAGRAAYQEQFAQIKALDPHRPTTYAACHGKDRCQDLPDICGWNRYPTWYADSSTVKDLAELLACAEPRGMAGKPLILSEFGGEGVMGYRDPVRRAKWSEDRQEDILREALECYLNHPRVAGVFIWQFCDVRVDDAWNMCRPRAINGKGIVDRQRNYKLAWPLVRDLFRKKLGDFRRDQP